MAQYLSVKRSRTLYPLLPVHANLKTPPNAAVRYGVAIVATSLAMLLSVVFHSVFEGAPFMLFWPAVIISTWYGDLGPGLLSILLSTLAVSVVFHDPSRHAGRVLIDALQVIIFVLMNVSLSWLHYRRRQAETWIIRQGRWFETTLTSLGDGVIVTDENGDVLFLNPAACMLTGWTASEAAHQPVEAVYQSLDEATRAPLANPARRVLDDGNASEAATPALLVARGGERRHVESGATPVRDEEGGLRGAVLVFRDISRRRQAEAARQHSEAMLRASREAGLEGFMILKSVRDANRRIVDFQWEYANPAVHHLAAFSAEVLVGRRLLEVSPESGRPDGPFEWCLGVVETGEPRTVERNVPETGRWVQTAIIRLDDGVAVTLTDITAIKRTEKALMEVQELVRRQLAEIEGIYDTAPIGLGVLDADLRFVRINERLAEMNGIPVAEHIGRTVREVLPSIADLTEASFRRVIDAGEPMLNVELRGETPAQPGVMRTWIENWTPLKDGTGKIVGVNIVADEVTEHVRNVQRLQHLRDLAVALAGALTPAEVVHVLVINGIQALGASSAVVALLDPSQTMLETVETFGYPMPLPERLRHFPRHDSLIALSVAVHTGQPLWGEPQAPHPVGMTPLPQGNDPEDRGGVWACLPLRTDGQIAGGVCLHFEGSHRFDDGERGYILSVIDYCAQALGRSRLYDLEQRTRQTAVKNAERVGHLQDITAALAQALTVEQVADVMAGQGMRALGAARGSTYLLVDQGAAFEVICSSSPDKVARDANPYGRDELCPKIPASAENPMTGVVMNRRPLWAVSAEEMLTRYPALAAEPSSWLGAEVMLPIWVQKQPFGGVRFEFDGARVFEPEEVALITAMVQQGTLTLERVMLHEEARKAAALHERERLARELHDAVSQSLFAASIIAESLRLQWQRSPEKVPERLEQLHQLTHGAQAEMRTLLLELRPAALLASRMKALLIQLSDAVRSRRSMDIRLDADDWEPSAPDVKIGLYRIAQEALNNVVKHASASHVEISLKEYDGGIEMRILDDGKGFDPAAVGSSRLGLGIMHERASAIGAMIEVQSHLGQGTTISVRWNASAAY